LRQSPIIRVRERSNIMSAGSMRNKNLREAIRILMMSPFYFKMALTDRKVLIQEFCALYANEK